GWKRTAGNGRFAADLIYDVSRLSDGHLGFEIGGTQLHTDTTSALYEKTSDIWYRLQGSYLLQWQGIEWKAAADYRRASIKSGADSVAAVTALGNLAVQALMPISSKLTAIAGVKLQAADSDSFSQKNRFSPFGRLNLMPNNRLGIAATVETGYTWPTFSEYWAENPFIAHGAPLRPHETDLAIQVTSDFQVADDLKFRLGISRSWMAEMTYWWRNDTDGLFGLQPIGDVQLTELQASVAYELSPRTRLHAGFISYSEKLLETNALAGAAGLPYRPDYRLPVRLHLQLLQEMHLTLHADVVGKRKSRLNSNSRLPAFAMLQASLTQEFNRFALILTAKNLLDTDYVIWEDYPETGTTVLGGVLMKF
ncbi:TonB-dependent receptor, partial [candidate division KSB1 bacterium]|nr:TonB-dependent receptor [candidate division KSB1 bacterium]